ncbi:MAG: DUF3575 domain-containing protein [Bacteroidales bacterium]|nr:DUF3575 domain-containing protein [Bacteroidales bacterium]
MKHFILPALCLLLSATLSAQEFSLSTNLLDWANLGTANLQAGVACSRHLSLHAGARYNNWNFGSVEKGNPFQNRARTASLGLRWWPWNVSSSWWFGAKAQVEEYNRGGLFRKMKTEEGIAVGAGAGFGYSWLVSDHWNLDLGLGFWAGRARYTLYRCPRCGRILSDVDGRPVRDAWKWFILPSNDVQVSLTYIF